MLNAKYLFIQIKAFENKMKANTIKPLKVVKGIYIFCFSVGITISVIAQNFPFPNHTSYQGNHIQPSQYSQSSLDNQVTNFYDQWKSQYVRNNCNASEYYVYASGALNQSSAQGFGMIITTIMAGYDPESRMIFDGMYQYYEKYSSSNSDSLMEKEQLECNTPVADQPSETLGDLTIAYALIMAHAQWGSGGTINYKNEALQVIGAIKNYELDINHGFLKLGDWVNSGNSYEFTTSPDLMVPYFFNAFGQLTGATHWFDLIDSSYSIIENIQTNESSGTGLLPDYINNIDIDPQPAAAYHYEGTHDGHFHYRANLFPLFIGQTYLLEGDSAAQNRLTTLNDWIIAETAGFPSNLASGYELSGNSYACYEDPAFIGPFCVSAMLKLNNQAWLDTLYGLLLTFSVDKGDYYNNTIKLMSLITVSKNYWSPPASLLDIYWLNFEADALLASSDVKLKWSVQHEGEQIHYQILYSRDVLKWELLNAEPTCLESGFTQQCQAIHTGAKPGKNFYKVNAVDQDGTIYTSAVENVFINTSDLLLTIYPNPAEDFLWIESNSAIIMRIFDLYGRQYPMSNGIQLVPGLNKIDVSALPSGFYYLQINGTNYKIILQ